MRGEGRHSLLSDNYTNIYYFRKRFVELKKNLIFF